MADSDDDLNKFFGRKRDDDPDISFFDLFESIFKEKVNEWVEN